MAWWKLYKNSVSTSFYNEYLDSLLLNCINCIKVFICFISCNVSGTLCLPKQKRLKSIMQLSNMQSNIYFGIIEIYILHLIWGEVEKLQLNVTQDAWWTDEWRPSVHSMNLISINVYSRALWIFSTAASAEWWNGSWLSKKQQNDISSLFTFWW